MSEQLTVGKSKLQFRGEGPGVQSRDGCSVEMYRLLPTQGEPEIIASCLEEGASILELGCGTGRITHPLLQRGFAVTAVDNSPDMLTHIRGANTVLADIETMRLSERFDAVLLMSHLINVPDKAIRQSLLETCRFHLNENGVVIIQRHHPTALTSVQAGYQSEANGITTIIETLEIDDDHITASIQWQIADQLWKQQFTTVLLDNMQVEQALSAAGLHLDQWLDGNQLWCTARRLT